MKEKIKNAVKKWIFFFFFNLCTVKPMYRNKTENKSVEFQNRKSKTNIFFTFLVKKKKNHFICFNLGTSVIKSE